MRLWHQNLIPLLPRQQLLGQHRECCALRGNSWGKRHSTVDYVFRYPPIMLFHYHMLVMSEMQKRGYKVKNPDWFNPNYRGQHCSPYSDLEYVSPNNPIYPEHNENYLNECIENLHKKGITLPAE